MERPEADYAKSDQVCMARDVATMFDELKALADRHAELHADRARLQAGLERLQDERNSAVLNADQAQQEIKRQRDQANALLSQVEDLNDSLDQMRRERQAEVGQLRAELKQERIRWWHRWFKR
jgi:predicted  nucleic acid-binding Zn-ribbon protein